MILLEAQVQKGFNQLLEYGVLGFFTVLLLWVCRHFLNLIEKKYERHLAEKDRQIARLEEMNDKKDAKILELEEKFFNRNKR